MLSDLKRPNKYRWNEIYNLSSNITRCGQENEEMWLFTTYRYKLDGINFIQVIWKDLNIDIFNITIYSSAEYVKSLFEKYQMKILIY